MTTRAIRFAGTDHWQPSGGPAGNSPDRVPGTQAGRSVDGMGTSRSCDRDPVRCRIHRGILYPAVRLPRSGFGVGSGHRDVRRGEPGSSRLDGRPLRGLLDRLSLVPGESAVGHGECGNATEAGRRLLRWRPGDRGPLLCDGRPQTGTDFGRFHYCSRGGGGQSLGDLRRQRRSVRDHTVPKGGLPGIGLAADASFRRAAQLAGMVRDRRSHRQSGRRLRLLRPFRRLIHGLSAGRPGLLPYLGAVGQRTAGSGSEASDWRPDPDRDKTSLSTLHGSETLHAASGQVSGQPKQQPLV